MNGHNKNLLTPGSPTLRAVLCLQVHLFYSWLDLIGLMIQQERTGCNIPVVLAAIWGMVKILAWRFFLLTFSSRYASISICVEMLNCMVI